MNGSGDGVNISVLYVDQQVVVSLRCQKSGKHQYHTVALVDVNANDHNTNVMSFAPPSKRSRYDNTNFCFVILFKLRLSMKNGLGNLMYYDSSIVFNVYLSNDQSNQSNQLSIEDAHCTC